MRNAGINGEGELRGQLAGSPGKMAVKMECVCYLTWNSRCLCLRMSVTDLSPLLPSRVSDGVRKIIWQTLLMWCRKMPLSMWACLNRQLEECSALKVRSSFSSCRPSRRTVSAMALWLYCRYTTFCTFFRRQAMSWVSSGAAIRRDFCICTTSLSLSSRRLSPKPWVPMTQASTACHFIRVRPSLYFLCFLLLHLTPPPPSSLASIKSRMETFLCRLTQVHLENGR